MLPNEEAKVVRDHIITGNGTGKLGTLISNAANGIVQKVLMVALLWVQPAYNWDNGYSICLTYYL